VKSIAATKIYNVVLACSSLFPIAGAIIADSFFGSFPVVSTFAFVSLLVIIFFFFLYSNVFDSHFFFFFFFFNERYEDFINQ
jgi:uncharacterized membrane protein